MQNTGPRLYSVLSPRIQLQKALCLTLELYLNSQKSTATQCHVRLMG